jgi:hypothetical protein
MVKQTIEGEAELDYVSSGVVWKLTCPAANALERSAQRSTRPALAPARNPNLPQLPAPTVH